MRLPVLMIMLSSCISSRLFAKDGTPKTAAACSNAYSQMAGVAFGPKFDRIDGFDFNGERFHFGRQIELTFAPLPKEKMQARFVRISEEDRYLREHIRLLKREAARPNRPEREMQEFIVIYSDNVRKSVRYTSNEHGEISPEAAAKALENSGAFTKDIVSITDIHTHPKARRSALFFSTDDVTGTRNLKAQIEQATGRKIEYRMILAPNCDACDDVILETHY